MRVPCTWLRQLLYKINKFSRIVPTQLKGFNIILELSYLNWGTQPIRYIFIKLAIHNLGSLLDRIISKFFWIKVLFVHENFPCAARNIDFLVFKTSYTLWSNSILKKGHICPYAIARHQYYLYSLVAWLVLVSENLQIITVIKTNESATSLRFDSRK